MLCYLCLLIPTFLDVFCSIALILLDLGCTKWDLSECYRPVASYRVLVEFLWENCTQNSGCLHFHPLQVGILRMSVSGQSCSCLWEIGKGLIGILSTYYCLEPFKKDLILWRLTSSSHQWWLGLPVRSTDGMPKFLWLDPYHLFAPCSHTCCSKIGVFSVLLFGKTHRNSFQCVLLCLCWFTDQSALLVLPSIRLVPFTSFLMWQIIIQHCFMQNISVLCISGLLASVSHLLMFNCITCPV